MNLNRSILLSLCYDTPFMINDHFNNNEYLNVHQYPNGEKLYYYDLYWIVFCSYNYSKITCLHLISIIL